MVDKLKCGRCGAPLFFPSEGAIYQCPCGGGRIGPLQRIGPTPTQDTRDRVKVLEEALERLSKPYFWTEDGFWADASTPAHRETELHQRLQIARTALGNKETYRG